MVNGAIILDNWEISDLEMLLKSCVLNGSQWLHLGWFQKSAFKTLISVLSLDDANWRQEEEGLWKRILKPMTNHKSQTCRDRYHNCTQCDLTLN